MADDAVIRLGYDNSKVRKGAAETRAIMQQTAKGVETSMVKAGGVVSKSPMMAGKGGGGMAQVGMQIQDIAVQMQMGTKAATIFAQQGSQMASAFGPAGVAIGATIAVVGGLYTAGDKSNEMFEAMIKNVGDLKAESDKLIKSGSLSEIVAQTTKLADASKELQKSSDALATMGGAFAPVAGMALGGDSPQERMNKLALAASDLEFKRQKLAISSLEVSKEEVELAKLKADGNTEAAEAMEREIALKRKIAQINEQPFSDRTKRQLIKDETKKSTLEAEGKNREKYEAEIQKQEQDQQKAADEMARAQEKYAAAQLERITDTETGQEKVNRLTQEYNSLLDEAAKHSASSVQYIEKSAAAQSKENELMREKKKLAEEAKEEALSNAQFMDNFRANRQNIRAGDAEKAKQEQAGNTEFMNDFRVRRDSLRWQERDREEAAQGMQSAFDGNRRTIKGYTGGLKEGRLAQDTGRLSKDTGLLGGGTFNEFFKPRDAAKSGAFKSGMTTNTRTHQGGAGGKPEEKLLTRIADSIESLAAN